MDAEYFQPKYEKIMSLIRANGGIALGELATMKKGFEPGSETYQDEGKLFIRVSSLSKFGIDNQDQKCLSEDLYQKLKKNHEPKVGEVLLTKDATPGISRLRHLSDPINVCQFRKLFCFLRKIGILRGFFSRYVIFNNNFFHLTEDSNNLGYTFFGNYLNISGNN